MGRKLHVKTVVKVTRYLKPLNRALQVIALPETAAEQALTTFKFFAQQCR
jgi:hypothetical protein